jgi:hypothetical protein
MPIAPLPPCKPYLGSKGGGMSKTPLGGCKACGAPLGGCGCVCCVPVWNACYSGVSPGRFSVDFAGVLVVLNRYDTFRPVTLGPSWTGTPDDLSGGWLYNVVPFSPYREFAIHPQCIWQSDVLDNIPGYGGPGAFYLFGGDEPEGFADLAWVTLLWVYFSTDGVAYSGVSWFNPCAVPSQYRPWPDLAFNPTGHNVWPNSFGIGGAAIDVYPG